MLKHWLPVEAVKSATMPSLGLKPVVKSYMSCLDISFGPFHGSWVSVVMGLKMPSSILKSTMGIDGSKEITSSWGWQVMEDEKEANECTKKRALNFKVCKLIKIIWSG